MTNPVMILNAPDERGRLKAWNLCDRLIHLGIAHHYELVGDCHTVTVAEIDVPMAMTGSKAGRLA